MASDHSDAAAQFGFDIAAFTAVMVLIEGGLSNSTYRLTCADGTRLVLLELAMGEVEDAHHAGDHAQAPHDPCQLQRRRAADDPQVRQRS